MRVAMNYRHIYHAGNFADIAKHVGLLYCLGALKRKDTAFFALDSHAGRGFYDLQAAEANKSGEAERGIQRLIEAGMGKAVLADYFTAIRARRGKRLARYPGSPALIAGSLRPQDRALFVELMPAEARASMREIESMGRVRTEIGDGYAVKKSLKEMVHFDFHNLKTEYLPPRNDVIFCRNVMIYFDKPTQSKILSKFVPLMKSNGLLFAGHSENFLYVSDALKLRGKTVYELGQPAMRRSGK